MKASVVLLPGDGVGPEVVDEGRRVLERVGSRFGHTFAFAAHLIGGAVIDASGNLDVTKVGGKSVDLWSQPFTERRAVYGFIERLSSLH